ncbi:3-dehydroquinate synthase [bacterium]|nr:MAG: 3-dehydroquinate synthase [bacterium]
MPQTATQRVDVSLGDRSYPIDIGAGLLAAPGALEVHVRARDVLLLTNTTVGPLYAEQVTRALGDRRIVDVRLPDGEQHKTLDNVARVLDVLVANRFGRDSLAIALGGGVVGDLCGFTAACYQRGIDFAQIPTTLLSQVDSSVGGKTGVNHPGGKNLIGAFHQPKFVLADTATLTTLPARELRAGLAEVIKYGLVFDPEFLSWLEGSMPRLLALDPEALAYAIRRSCELKADVVRRDEREQGDRALLNLGHTFGHAIESATGYTEWLHGEAVATGMLIAADLSRNMGLLPGTDVERVRELLRSAGLGADAPRIGAARALDYMRVDKKVKGGRIRLILLEKLGRGLFTADYPDDALTRTLATHFG